MVGVGVTKAKSGLKVSTDAPEHATHVPFGTSVTFSVQVVDSNDDPVAEKGIKLTISTFESDTDGNTRSGSQIHKTDASGRVEITRSYDDPDEDDDNADITLSVILRADDAGLLEDDTETDDVDESMPRIGLLTWSDSKAEAQTLVLGQSVAYHEASDTGGGVRHSVTATLLDQYGDPVSGAPIHFWSDANNGNRRQQRGTRLRLR